ncbi:SpoIIE family protein phosphatase [Rhodobacterales bacterium HKCCE2091]|nr:SpoIIE family protein phosphatase [Rhodobacterales bacterium HKCCE2091]
MAQADPAHCTVELDVASALSLGARERQEDALATAFPQGAEVGFAILSDGMGGHAAGDLASRIIVSEIFAELTLRSNGAQLRQAGVPRLLRYAADVANDCLRDHVEANPSKSGMGGTVITTLIEDGRLHWLSIGDSLLYLFRNNELIRLNEDHSMAPQIDLMVKKGLMDPDTARRHPQRSCLTSALIGETIAAVDCPDEPLELMEGDVIVAASDGLESLTAAEITAILKKVHRRDSRGIAGALIDAVATIGDPEQDNTSVVVMKAVATEHAADPAWVAPVTMFRAAARAMSPVRQIVTRTVR